jgi:hypothetical protein
MNKKTFIPGLLALALFAFSFTSCEKDKPLTEAIIGKWDVQKEQQVYSKQNVSKFEYIYYYEADDLAFEFTTGGTIIIYQYGDIFGTSTYTIAANKLTIEMGTTDMVWNNVVTNENTLSWTESGTDMVDEITYDVDINYTAAKTK